MGAANSCTIDNGQNQIANFNCNGAWHNTDFSLNSVAMLLECNSGGAPIEFGWIESSGFQGSDSFREGDKSGYILINDAIITAFWCNQD